MGVKQRRTPLRWHLVALHVEIADAAKPRTAHRAAHRAGADHPLRYQGTIRRVGRL